jgi:hypothetical protein
MPHLPPEQFVFGIEPVHAVPDPEDKDYILVNTIISETPESFNCVDRYTRTISISGKTLVFEEKHGNGLYSSYNGNDDIKEMNIYAETVIIRSPLRLPQTDVTIYARELAFEGSSACINTMPRSNTIRPGLSQDGNDGLKAGNITLHLDHIRNKDPNRSKYQFILCGGNGQPAGQGKDGDPGEDMAAVGLKQLEGYESQIGICTTHSTYVHYVDKYKLGDPNKWPGNGYNASPGGKAGNGGDGGDFSINCIGASESNVDISGGLPGAPADKTTYIGGLPGQPNPACRVWLAEPIIAWNIDEMHYSYRGEDAKSGEWGHRGHKGTFTKIPSKMSWLHPYILQMVLAYAKDAYLYGHLDVTEEILEDYLEVLETYRNSAEWDKLNGTMMQFEFVQMQDEMEILLHRIKNNLDYFGNPPGWVPMLSFEVNKAAFEEEIDHAIRVLYLSYWVGNAETDIQGRVDALTSVREQTEQEIQAFTEQYNELMALIPQLESEGKDVANQVGVMQGRLQAREQELLARAEENINERHKTPFWKQAARVLGTICSLCPVGQPAVGVIGGGLLLVSSIDENTSWETIAGGLADIAKTDYEKYGKDCKALGEAIDKVPDKIDPKSVGAYLKEIGNKAKPIGEQVKKYKDLFKETQIPKEEVEAELQSLKAADPEFNDLIDEIAELMAQKEALGQELATSIQLVSSLSNGITFDLLVIDGMNRGIAEGNAVLDPRASMYLEEMDRRARERLLKYHYYMAKAYEYRLLEPYPGELNLDSMFNKFKKIVEESSNHNLGPDDFDALKALYEEQLSTVAFDIYNRYQSNPPELSVPIRYNLTQEEIQTLNAREPVTINLVERGLFPLSEENIRILKLKVKTLDVHMEGGDPGDWAYLDIYMDHAGLSKLVRDGEVYQFRHYNPLTENPITWGARYDGIDHTIDSIEPSAASESLLRSLIDLDDEELLIYSRPAAWADITLTKNVETQTGIDMVIDSLRLEATYDFMKTQDKVKMQVLVSEDGMMPYFIVDTEDLNGRQDGRGNFFRTYTKNPNAKVTVKAPAAYGMWQFEKWTDRYGNDLGDDPTNRVLELNLGTDQIIRAQMGRISGSISGKVTYTCNATGIAGATVNLTQDGSVINSTVTNSNGEYTFTNVFPGGYEVNASKPRFWDNATEVTVTAGATTEADMMLWLKGDVYNDGVLDIYDIIMLRQAAAENIPWDYRYDLYVDAMVDIYDIIVLRQAVAGNIVLD